MERVLDFFKNRRGGARDDEIVIVDYGGENVGEFCSGAVEVAIHVDNEFALVAKLLNRGRGVFLVFEFFVDSLSRGLFGVYGVGGCDGRNAQCTSDDGEFYLDAPPENAYNCTTFFSRADA